jgi:hypothetical protein
MTPNTYLGAVKDQKGLPSDYALGIEIGVSPKALPAIRRGERAMPIHASFRIAEILNLNPARVIADLEEQREKDEDRRAFFQSFLQRAA